MFSWNLAWKVLPFASAAVAMIGFAGGAHAFQFGAGALSETGTGCLHESGGLNCGSLFQPGTILYPGGPAQSRTVGLVYSGGSQPSLAGLYVDGFVSKDGTSDRQCTAADPAAGLSMTVTTPGATLYEGTVSDFAAGHGEPGSVLPVPGLGSTAVPVTITIGMPKSDGNEYMGCQTRASFNWFAAA